MISPLEIGVIDLYQPITFWADVLDIWLDSDRIVLVASAGAGEKKSCEFCGDRGSYRLERFRTKWVWPGLPDGPGVAGRRGSTVTRAPRA